MIGPWALVRNDGAASMCYCPDFSSKHQGYNPVTGASGLGYFHYLRCAGAFVLPNRSLGTYTFGCHYEFENNQHVIRPWDGVGRRVVLRQIGAEFSVSFGRIVLVTLDARKRYAEITIENPSDKVMRSELTVKGLWGTHINIQNKTCVAENGCAKGKVDLPPGKLTKMSVVVAK